MYAKKNGRDDRLNRGKNPPNKEACPIEEIIGEAISSKGENRYTRSTHNEESHYSSKWQEGNRESHGTGRGWTRNQDKRKDEVGTIRTLN